MMLDPNLLAAFATEQIRCPSLGWRRVTSPLEAQGSPQELAQQFADVIEAEYSNADIAALVANKGLKVEPA